MNIASLQFLAFAAAAACLYNLFRPMWWRQFILLAANIIFLSTFISRVAELMPLAGFLLLGFAGGKAMRSPTARKAFVPLLVAVIGTFIWLKQYGFLPSSSFLRYSYTTIGISYILFRILHVMVDVRTDNLPGNIGPLSYLNYTLNFMTLVSGPIQRYEDFAETQLAPERPPLTIFMAGEGIHRVIVGFFKITVLSWLLFILQKQSIGALLGNPFFGSKALTGALVVVTYPFYLYCNFSGYTDIVIGIGRFFRFFLPENFDRPFSSDNFMNFWSRWHITLSNWLKTYVFNPLLLASMRRISSVAMEPFLVVPALFVTFFLVGIWHGQTSEFVMFGFLQGFGVAVNQLYQILLSKWLGRGRYNDVASKSVYLALSRGLTFTWFAFTLLWFWSNWGQMREIVLALRGSGVFLTFLSILLVSSIALSLFDTFREWILSFRWNASPVAQSRYALTVLDTGLAVVSLVVVILLNAPAPDIVYKAF